MPHSQQQRTGKIAGYLFLIAGIIILVTMIVLLRLAIVTDYLYHAMVKDPERVAPTGHVMVSPADGTVLYVRRITGGMIPEVVKRGVPIPIVDHLKIEPERPFNGYLIGIYMNTQGVHVNRAPNHATLKRQWIFNGPHMNMTAAESKIILTQMIPGLVSAKKMLGLAPFDIEQEADFILNSARETLLFEDERGAHLYVVRIADYYVGKILTWVNEGDTVVRGQKLGMITWGSQTDFFIEASPGLEITTQVGDYVYGGETVVATY